MVSLKSELFRVLAQFQTQSPYLAEDQVAHPGIHPGIHTLPESDE